eukprot:scaffold466133_cov27-Prasinocladus_malaysianus.AAC.1
MASLVSQTMSAAKSQMPRCYLKHLLEAAAMPMAPGYIHLAFSISELNTPLFISVYWSSTIGHLGSKVIRIVLPFWALLMGDL